MVVVGPRVVVLRVSVIWAAWVVVVAGDNSTPAAAAAAGVVAAGGGSRRRRTPAGVVVGTRCPLDRRPGVRSTGAVGAVGAVGAAVAGSWQRTRPPSLPGSAARSLVVVLGRVVQVVLSS